MNKQKKVVRLRKLLCNREIIAILGQPELAGVKGGETTPGCNPEGGGTMTTH